MWDHVQSGTPAREAAVAHGPAAAAQPDPARHALLVMPARPASVRSARHIAEALLRRWDLCADDRYTAVLVVDELAANAAEHGHRRLTLRLDLGPEVLRVRARDHGGGRRPARPGQDTDPDEHGRGLAIIDALAARMEIRRDAAGWCVAVELPVTRHGPGMTRVCGTPEAAGRDGARPLD
ncbi:ATP-binding protein [Streptomyces sp. NPDC004096]|uniref:ATP-binding protein n=1 Tax=unclassified Streptomyces TaxID=2593676 RepID=UPI0033A687DC